MNAKSEKLLVALDSIEWFARTGVQDVDATVVDSWQQAILLATNERDWESFRLERRGELTVFLHQNAMERYRRWNELTLELKKIVEPLVSRKIEDAVTVQHLPSTFEATVRWDILGACMEAEYSDLSKLGFYTDLAGVYLNGHFPCGWDGPWPIGRFVVY
jgi:hypothetical protein